MFDPLIPKMTFRLRGLIDMAEQQIKNDYQKALAFIPSESFQRGKTSGLDKAHRILSDELAKLDVVREEFHAAAQTTYKDHPNPEMRKFWGLTE